jgi:hypothetical protein
MPPFQLQGGVALFFVLHLCSSVSIRISIMRMMGDKRLQRVKNPITTLWRITNADGLQIIVVLLYNRIALQ